MKKVLLSNEINFYKANLHNHTVYSDGKFTPEQIKEEYKKRGYSVVAFTDHEHLIDNSYLNDEEFLTITSAEHAVKEFALVSTLKNFNMKVVHLNIYAKDPHNTTTPCYSSIYDHYITDKTKDKIKFDAEYEREYSSDKINDMVKRCKEAGFLVSYNHPSWSLENANDYIDYEGFFAVEIYNHGVLVEGGKDDENVFDDILRSGKRIFCTACDDNHNEYPLDSVNCDSFGGWVQINAEKLEYNAIMTALEEGNFYASTGPEIYSLVRDGDTVTIKTSDARNISLTTRGRKCLNVIAEPDKAINEATFELEDGYEYFRIRVTDKEGKSAYTQAYDI